MGEKKEAKSLGDFLKEAENNWAERIKKSQWGHWKYNPNNLTLAFRKRVGDDETYYEVDLERCNTSAEMLDWIFQIKNKNWCSDKDIADLLRAFDDLMDTVQDKICSGGINGRFNVKKHLLKQITPILKKKG